MPISKNHLSVFVALLLSALLCVWISQHSINRYWQQSYHQPSPLLALNRFALWRMGGVLQQSANHLYEQARERIHAIDQRIIATQSPQPNDEQWSDDIALNEEQQALFDTLGMEEEANSQTTEEPLISEQNTVENTEDSAQPANNLPTENAQTQALNQTPSTSAQTTESASTESASTESALPNESANKAPIIGARDLTQSAVSNPEPTQALNQTPSTSVQTTENTSTSASTESALPNESANKAPIIGARDLTQSAVSNSQPTQALNQTSSTSAQPTESALPNDSANKAPIIGARDLTQSAVSNPQPTQALNQTSSTSAQPTENTATESALPNESANKAPIIGARDLTQSAVSNPQPTQALNQTPSTSVQPTETTSTESASTETALPNESANKAPIIGARDLTQSAVSNSQPTQALNQTPSTSAQPTENTSTSAQTTQALNQSTSNPQTDSSASANTQPTNKAEAPNKSVDLERITLSAGDKVLLIGDSLMQGVAPFVQQTLQQRYNINTLNLSKQSTGLSYPDFFDWPAEVEKTLAADAEIKAVVVFLGPNDPWDFPDPSKGEKSPYLKFKSKEWEAVYRSRISRIVQIANAHGAGVIWLGIPFMKPEPLNSQMQYLDSVMRSEMRNKGIFVPTKYILTGGAPEYVESIMLDGKSVRLRSKDGIHFTPSGQKQIAIAIMRRFQIAQP